MAMVQRDGSGEEALNNGDGKEEVTEEEEVCVETATAESCAAATEAPAVVMEEGDSSSSSSSSSGDSKTGSGEEASAEEASAEPDENGAAKEPCPPRHQYSKAELLKLRNGDHKRPDCLDPAYNNLSGMWDPERWFSGKRRGGLLHREPPSRRIGSGRILRDQRDWDRENRDREYGYGGRRFDDSGHSSGGGGGHSNRYGDRRRGNDSRESSSTSTNYTTDMSKSSSDGPGETSTPLMSSPTLPDSVGTAPPALPTQDGFDFNDIFKPDWCPRFLSEEDLLRAAGQAPLPQPMQHHSMVRGSGGDGVQQPPPGLLSQLLRPPAPAGKGPAMAPPAATKWPGRARKDPGRNGASVTGTPAAPDGIPPAPQPHGPVARCSARPHGWWVSVPSLGLGAGSL
ncbi:hypothetical protein MTO96_033431 [Rhipicephalus appendiculatus]